MPRNSLIFFPALAIYILLMPALLKSQTYTSYFTGDTDDVSPQTEFGICLMGGASENDQAMLRFLEYSGGGDIVVLRATGSDGYNNYLYSSLGAEVNSVETIVTESREAAQDNYVVQQLKNAEAVWIAGGDQYDYIQFWKDSPLEDALNNHMNVKRAPIGGTSAGMAILGAYYFSAENGTVYSDEALQNPYNQYMTIGSNDFMTAPFLANTITDTHYDNPKRNGRHIAFMARMVNDYGIKAFGIACEEYTAVFIDENGKASVYGNSNYEDYAYFLQTNCQNPYEPENCQADEPLTWYRNEAAVKAFKIKGEETGSNYLDLTDYVSGKGGEWQNWYVSEGELFMKNSEAPDCPTSIDKDAKPKHGYLFPNPADRHIRLYFSDNFSDFRLIIYNTLGEAVLTKNSCRNGQTLNISGLQPGIYWVKTQARSKTGTYKLIVNR